MAEEDPLAGLLDRAGNVFSLAGKLGRAFYEEHREQQSRPGFIDPATWDRHAHGFNEFCAAVLDLREPMQNPPDGFKPVAKPLVEAARIAKGIRDAMQRPDGRDWAAYREFSPSLISVCENGWEAVKAVTKARRLDDPFAFVDEPAATPAFSRLNQFPATPAGHVAFLEWVRREVRVQANALRKEKHSDESIDKQLRQAIKWPEARSRLAALSNLPEGVRAKADEVLRRELTAGTVEQIDALLTPAVWGVRDSWEQARRVADAEPKAQANTAAGQGEPAEATSDTSTPTKTKRSTERGEGRTKLIAALTKHHQYADGGCLNVEPIGNNELARLAKVDQATASAFFKQEFKGHGNYKAACADAAQLTAALKLLNGEFAPHLLYGSKPADEDERDEE
jgi:hypothetical protein